MEYSRIYFGKELEELDYGCMKSYFQTHPREESNKIEYKSYVPRGSFESKLEAIYESVCSFLNAEGGMLVWGAPKGKKQDGKEEHDRRKFSI